MNLNEARRTAKQLRKAGILATIRHDRAACLLNNPRMHAMCGDCVVTENGIAQGFTAPRVWTNLLTIRATPDPRLQAMIDKENA